MKVEAKHLTFKETFNKTLTANKVYLITLMNICNSDALVVLSYVVVFLLNMSSYDNYFTKIYMYIVFSS